MGAFRAVSLTAILAIAVAAGCSSGSPDVGGTPAPFVGGPDATASPLATSTPLAIESIAAPTPFVKPTNYYTPPGWDGVSDVNCKDFDTHAHAASFFKGMGGTKTNDPYGLDGDHDGNACETLP